MEIQLECMAIPLITMSNYNAITLDDLAFVVYYILDVLCELTIERYMTFSCVALCLLN